MRTLAEVCLKSISTDGVPLSALICVDAGRGEVCISSLSKILTCSQSRIQVSDTNSCHCWHTLFAHSLGPNRGWKSLRDCSAYRLLDINCTGPTLQQYKHVRQYPAMHDRTKAVLDQIIYQTILHYFYLADARLIDTTSPLTNPLLEQNFPHSFIIVARLANCVPRW